METVEGNKLIDDFAPEITGKMQWNIPKHIAEHEWLKYHSSWDWLMPAWGKFYENVINTEWYQDNGDKESQFQFDCMEASLGTANLPAAFKHFINLLQWYNKNK